jgi:hypothetical protein
MEAMNRTRAHCMSMWKTHRKPPGLGLWTNKNVFKKHKKTQALEEEIHIFPHQYRVVLSIIFHLYTGSCRWIHVVLYFLFLFLWPFCLYCAYSALFSLMSFRFPYTSTHALSFVHILLPLSFFLSSANLLYA